MSNLDKYYNVFTEAFSVSKDKAANLKYQDI